MEWNLLNICAWIWIKIRKTERERERNMKIQSAFNHIRGERQQSQSCWSEMRAYRFDGNEAVVRTETNGNIPLHSPWMDPLWLHPHATMKNASNERRSVNSFILIFYAVTFCFSKPEKKSLFNAAGYEQRRCDSVEPINNGHSVMVDWSSAALSFAIFHCHNLLWFMKTSVQCH